MPPKRTQKSDPYFQSKASIEKKIADLKQTHEQWKYILEKKNTSNDPQFNQLMESLRFSLKEITGDIGSIAKVNAHVEQHRERFAQIDDIELQNRKAFVSDVRHTLHEVDQSLNSERTLNKLKDDRDKAGAPVKLRPGQTGDQMVKQRHMEQQAMKEVEDQVLEDMTSALGRLNINAQTINTELNKQTQILEEMDQNIDNNLNLMDTAMAKMDLVLNKSTAAKWTIIIVEAVIIVILLLLFIYA